MSALKNARFILLALVAAWFVMTAANTVPGPDPVEEYDLTPGCRVNCLIADGVSIKPMSKGDSTTLVGTIRIVDENGKAVGNAVVVVKWTMPGRTSVQTRVTTDRNGYAETTILAMQPGEYQLTVRRAILDGYQFDRTKGDCTGEIAL